jgi:hypothetical protein
MKMLISILYLGISIIIIGCSNQNPTQSENTNNLVVEGFLYANEPINNIQLTKTIGLDSQDTLAPPVNDALVWLIKNNKSYKLTQDPGRNGYYIYSGSDLSIESGDNFILEISYEGKEITSSTIVPPKPEDVTISNSTLVLSNESGFPSGGFGQQDTNSIYVRWINPDSSLYYVVVENLDANPEEISTGNFPGGMNIVRRTTFSPTATSEFVIGRRNLTYYGNHRAIVYKVNQEYADLYESRNQDSRNLNEPLTNIKNGLGVFSAFASYTVYFNVKSD